MDKIAVKPARAGLNLVHPNGTPLPDTPAEGDRWPEWPADQFTYRRLRDGDIERAIPTTPDLEKPATATRQIKGS